MPFFDDTQIWPQSQRKHSHLRGDLDENINDDDEEEDSCKDEDYTLELPKWKHISKNDNNNIDQDLDSFFNDMQSDYDGDNEEEEETIGSINPVQFMPEQRNTIRRGVKKALTKMTFVVVPMLLAMFVGSLFTKGGFYGFLNRFIPLGDYNGQGYGDGGGMEVMYADDLYYGEEDIDDDSPQIQTEHDDSNKEEEEEEEEEDQIIEIPDRYSNLAELDLNNPFDNSTNLAVYWHVPRSGGATVDVILNQCDGLVAPSHLGADTDTPDGIQKTESLHLVEQNLANYIYTVHVYEASILFSSTHQGRMFTLFRHPVDRAVSMYYFLRSNPFGTPTYASYMSLEKYAFTAQTEHNWMTRVLVNDNAGQLFPRHLDQAKEVIRRKCLVGLTSNFEESIKRFRTYFGWDEDSKQQQCSQEHLHHGENELKHPPLKEDSDVWMEFMRRNYFDLQLYEYAQQLFEEQTALFE